MCVCERERECVCMCMSKKEREREGVPQNHIHVTPSPLTHSLLTDIINGKDIIIRYKRYY